MGIKPIFKWLCKLWYVWWFKFILVFRVGGAATAIAILSGAAVERMTFLGWAILSVIYSGFVYAALVHWTLASGW